jgi:undecaprenyl-diphosphatase
MAEKKTEGAGSAGKAAGGTIEAAKASAKTAEPVHTPVEAVAAAAEELSFGARFLARHGWRLLPVFIGLLLPMLFFAGIVEEYREDGILPFDKPVLLWIHQLATPAIDQLFVTVSDLGYQWGVVPVNIIVLAYLVLHKRYREGLFWLLSVGGSALLNVGVKTYFARDRPDLWVQVVEEHSFSFPSGHAMASATLATALALLAWRTRYHWPAVILLPAFALVVGLARIYLGVHYPSDILAGFAVAVAWVFAMHQVVGRAPKPRAEAADSSIEVKAQETKASDADKKQAKAAVAEKKASAK